MAPGRDQIRFAISGNQSLLTHDVLLHIAEQPTARLKLLRRAEAGGALEPRLLLLLAHRRHQ